jgi:hypothetical protein
VRAVDMNLLDLGKYGNVSFWSVKFHKEHIDSSMYTSYPAFYWQIISLNQGEVKYTRYFGPYQ